jgi:hypothetical protein
LVTGAFYGAYNYSQLPITLPVLFDADGTIYQFNIFDLANPNCINFAEVGPVDCGADCAIEGFVFERGDCNNDGSYVVEIDFDVSNPGNDFFDVFNGRGEIIGTYRIADLPIRIPNYPHNGFVTDTVKVCINDTPDCCTDLSFDSPPCVDLCQIKAPLDIDIVDCTNSEFYLKINFDYLTVSDSFFLGVASNPLGFFSYANLPVVVGPFPKDPNILYNAYVYDQVDVSCTQRAFIGSVTCTNTCRIWDLEREIIDCEQGEYYMELFYNFTDSDSIRVFIDGTLYGEYDNYQQPILVGPFIGDGQTPVVVQLKDIIDPSCATDEITFQPVFCDSLPCLPGLIARSVFDCTPNGTFPLVINFDNPPIQTDSFTVANSLNQFVGRYAIADLPVTIPNYRATAPAGSTKDFIAVTLKDNQNTLSCQVEFVIPDCASPDCEIGQLEATVIECDNDEFFVKIDFEFSQGVSDSFNLLGNGQGYGRFAYSDLPVTLGPLNADGTTFYEYVAIDSENPDCKNFVELGTVECNNGTCEMGAMKLDVVECLDSVFYVRIDFEVANTTSDFFNLSGNGRDYGLFSYADLPLTFGPLTANDQTVYEFLASDKNDPNCATDAELGTVNCVPDCEIEITTESIACNPDGSFSVLVNVVYQYPNIDSVSLFYPTLNFPRGTYALADMPIIITDFPSTAANQSFLIAKTDNGCAAETLVEQLDCDNCELFNLKTRISPCDNDDRFDVTIDFDFNNIGNVGFQVIDQQGTSYGPFNYNELPITLENITAQPGGVSIFTIFDILNFNCSLTATVDHPDCVSFCDDFNDIDLGEYPAADFEEDDVVFTVNDVPVYMLPFQYSNGGSDRIKFVMEEIFNPALLPVRGHALFTGNTTALFDFNGLSDKVTRVTIDITLGHPEYNLAVNGEPVQVVSNLFFLPEDIAPGVKLTVAYANNQNTTAQLTFTGSISSLRIGGVESSIDNLCIETKPFADRECIQFEGLPCCLAITPATHNPGTVIHVENRALVSYEEGTLWIESTGRCNDFNNASGNHLFIDGSLKIDFNELPETPEEVSFNYSSCENTVSIQFNQANVFDVIPLDDNTVYTTPNGLTIKVEAENINAGYQGRITIIGLVRDMLVKGTGFAIDDICFDVPDGLIVWPGDANNDNIANHFDLLFLGMAWGEKGPNRGSVTDTWTGIPGTEWGELFGDQETDFMHADCNGDGRIDEEDLAVLEANIYKTHGSFPALIELPADDNDPALYLNMGNNTTIRDGGTLNIPIELGTDDQPINNIYGIAFTITYDPAVIDPNSLELDLSSTWIGEVGSEAIVTQQHDPVNGRIDVAISRNDKNEISGKGTVASVIGIIDNIAGKVTTDLNISNVKAIDAQAQRIPIYTIGGSMEVLTNNSNLPIEEQLGLFPNPAYQYLTISSPVDMQNVVIYDILGRQVYSQKTPVSRHQIHLSQWADGMYLANIRLHDGRMVVKKFEVIKQ